MSYAEFLHSTPPEINLKIEAWNDGRRREAARDYSFAVLLLNGRNEPKKFPSFERYYPEIDPETQEQKVDRHVSQAMETARKLGDI